jgi:hypothetical protein
MLQGACCRHCALIGRRAVMLLLAASHNRVNGAVAPYQQCPPACYRSWQHCILLC